MSTVPALPHRRRPRLLQAAVVVLVVLEGTVALLLANEWGTRWSPEHVGRGSGVAATESRVLPGFTALDVAGANEVIVHVGDEQSVVVEADDNLIDRLTTEVNGRTLVLGTEGSFTTEVPMTVDVTVPTLQAIALTGSGLVVVDDVKAQQLTIRLPGSGILIVSGSASRLDVELSGSGDVRLEDLLAREVSATLSGSGRVQVHATESLVASVSGSGVIVYTGDPDVIRQHITGSGAVIHGAAPW